MKLGPITVCLATLLSLWTAAACGASSGPTVTATTVALSATAVPTVAPTTSPPTSTTTTTMSPARVILEGMSLQEKAAQVFLFGFEGATLMPSTTELLEYGPPGGLLLLGYNVEGASQLRSLTFALQQAAAAGGSPLELLIAVDQEGGAVQRIHEGAPDLPAARELGEVSSPAEAARLASDTAAALLDLGVNMNLAPVADVTSDPGSFLFERTYGGDPEVVSAYVAAVTRAFADAGLIAVVKHFPGHGSATGNPHGESALSDAGAHDFETIHLPPFKAAFAEGADCVMVAHLIASTYDPELPASLSAAVVTHLLRDELGFTGVVLTDDLEMAAVEGIWAAPAYDSSEDPTVSDPTVSNSSAGAVAVYALEAGCDLLISTGTLDRHKALIDAVERAAETGELSPERLDEAVLRVIDLKLAHGLVPLRVP